MAALGYEIQHSRAISLLEEPLAVRRGHGRRVPARRHVRHFRLVHRLHGWPYDAVAHVVANRLQALQNGLPLPPFQLTQERPQPLDERILEECLTRRFGNKETIQSDAQGFRDFFQRAEARRHLAAFDARKVGTRDP